MRPSLLLALLPLPLALSSGRTASPSLRDAAFLTGCWAMRDARRVVEERWLPPLGNTMVNVGRTVRGDSLVDYELVVLREGRGSLAYEAHPAGQAPATFLAADAAEGRLVFRNATHDFPQEVGYERRGADSLHAWIAGTMDGRARRVDFPYARAACGA